MKATRPVVGLHLSAVAVVLAAVGLVSCTPSPPPPTVTVLGAWTGDEATAFRAMIDKFERSSNIRVNYIGTRDADAVLGSELSNGKPPDLAVLATPGRLREYAKDGTLRPLDAALGRSKLADQYRPGWLDLMRATGPAGEDHYYAIIVKATLKSIVWYEPRRLPAAERAQLTSPDLTWDGLTRVAGRLAAGGIPPWCMGMEDSSNSGWPGTDWIEDILLHQSGPAAYDRWIDGTLGWQSTPVRQAWRTWGEVVGTGLARDGTTSALLTNAVRAGQRMFSDPPGCYLDHSASFATGFYATAQLPANGGPPQPARDYNFVPFPRFDHPGTSRAEEVAGDLLGMFRDTSAARQLIAYLTTPEAQQVWTTLHASGAISPNLLVRPGDYKDPISQRLARILAEASTVRFDASDSMPEVLEGAFNYAALSYLDSPGQLDTILSGLDRVRTVGR